jgi:hypothetical protein
MANSKETFKNILGELPFTAELYWFLRQRNQPIQSRFSLKFLHENITELRQQALLMQNRAKRGKKIFMFATIHYWIEHATLLGMTLAVQGNEVTLGFLPYYEWMTPINRFDLRRHNLYAKKLLGKAEDLIHPISLMNVSTSSVKLPQELVDAVNEVATYDVQYTSQIEDVDYDSSLYKLRHRRDEHVAKAALAYFHENRPDQVIVPNGTVQEFGVIYRVAKYLKIPTVTYEFGEQKDRIWIAQNAEIMKQDTDAFWTARQNNHISATQLKKIRDLFEARQKGALWENFSRRWQGAPTAGGKKVREQLRLDDRPVVLLATNVVGDSLTLGRQVFSKSMTEWLSRTVQYFSGRPDVQLLIRVHPGEALLKGVSISEVINHELPKLPEYIHLIGPRENINTYDLISIADLGLVYTTTVGLEMALSGVPVIVSGKTHYSGRGFTIDPDSWVSYFKILGQMFCDPRKFKMSKAQVDLTWKYAYYFFFDFSLPFPWILSRYAEDYKSRPFKAVLSKEGKTKFGNIFKYFAGTELDWSKVKSNE